VVFQEKLQVVLDHLSKKSETQLRSMTFSDSVDADSFSLEDELELLFPSDNVYNDFQCFEVRTGFLCFIKLVI
jgi:hypothetical protein